MERTCIFSGDHIVAAFNSPASTGETFGSPIVIGWREGADEVFIRKGDTNINIQAVDVRALCKYLAEARDRSAP